MPPPLILYRAMINDEGKPKIGRSARMLGVRPGRDVRTDAAGYVHPWTGGMSVVPDDLHQMAPFRLHRTFGGRSTDILWALNAALLPAALSYRTDTPGRHGLIEPARIMTLADYVAALAATRSLWMRVFALALEPEPC